MCTLYAYMNYTLFEPAVEGLLLIGIQVSGMLEVESFEDSG